MARELAAIGHTSDVHLNYTIDSAHLEGHLRHNGINPDDFFGEDGFTRAYQSISDFLRYVFGRGKVDDEVTIPMKGELTEASFGDPNNDFCIYVTLSPQQTYRFEGKGLSRVVRQDIRQLLERKGYRYVQERIRHAS